MVRINFLPWNCITKDSGTVMMTFRKPRDMHMHALYDNNDFITVFPQKVALTNSTSQKEHEDDILL
jgi:hypothetical protein